MKLLIAGATGFIGHNITEYYAKDSTYDVHAVYFESQPFDIKNVTWHQGDLRNPLDAKRLLKDVDIVVQAAATTSGARDIVNTPYIHVTDNAVMNSYLLREAFNQKIKHFIFFSCTVMYQPSNDLIKESDFNANIPILPKYFGIGNTKVYIEKMCDFYSRICDTKFTVIRHSNIYGPHDKFDLDHSHVFGATVTKVMEAKDKITVWGDGSEGRDLLYVDDLTHFVNLAIRNQTEGFKLYNCGYGEAIPIKTLVEKIIQHSGKSLKIEFDTSQPTIKTNVALDCSLAQNELHWTRETSLEEGIEKTIQWWKSNIKK